MSCFRWRRNQTMSFFRVFTSLMETYEMGGPKKLIQKWLCLESHCDILSSHSPLLTSLWSRQLQSCSLPLVQDHDPTQSLGTAIVFSPGHLNSKLITVGSTLFSFSNCIAEAELDTPDSLDHPSDKLEISGWYFGWKEARGRRSVLLIQTQTSTL